MRAVVREAFVPFTAPLEGVVRHLYADVKGLVTTGIGNLVDPVAAAIILPWKRPDGSLAGRDEVLAEWMRVKNDPDAPRYGHRYTATITTLRLDDEDVTELVMRKLDQNDALLLRRFPEFESWPADAQLATHSMAWACGPAFDFPRLAFALRARDFLLAAQECRMNETGNPGLRPRNVANKTMYRNASMAPNPAELYWPRDLAAEPDTIPEVRLDLLESEPPPAVVSERILYAVPDPPKHEPATYDDGWKDDDDGGGPEAA